MCTVTYTNPPSTLGLGSIISAAWVLTAAHCSSGSPSLSILAGAHNRDGTDPTSVTVSASRIIVHPGYNYSLFQNDVAVVELQSPLTYTRKFYIIYSGSVE